MTEAFLLDGVRTPIGRYAGALAHVRPDSIPGFTAGNSIAVTLLGRLERAGARRGPATMCVGVGQGTALLLERP